MVTRQPSVKGDALIEQQTLHALCSRNPHLAGALDLLFRNAAESLSFQELRVQPTVGVHRNLVSEEPFLMPKERFGGSQDIALVPFMRTVVDETLRAYSATSPHLLEYVGKDARSPPTEAWA